jgi:hypothetical protein
MDKLSIFSIDTNRYRRFPKGRLGVAMLPLNAKNPLAINSETTMAEMTDIVRLFRDAEIIDACIIL